ncbi:hypothetical protein FC50_GL000936 [Lacticaseibacillus pantheris DSM 15945 = JCM 12539 = NBRC 106106]|uniref:Uncharacterized protein n=1 Tax=Lacticaseibacillus pantheris DSM 15945 = JCM 12539 = NBRC 106106 TaxID=1423783 RepID=A0A0R1U0D5_9LACO|nr:hypothetical protein [Lacticaseibacillus pantheris]KRL86414.1 hypothetical protein FC50_GL000936 [Lacticaseibacillus pantheris DSM 15945 = JCM 12539 = NBRC 106106]
MAETFREYIGGLVYEANRNLTPDDWKRATGDTPHATHPCRYYMRRYRYQKAQHWYYLVRDGDYIVELPNYHGPEAKWTTAECKRVDPEHKYERILVEDENGQSTIY